MRPVLVILAAYLLGSIPFGYLIVRSVAGADVRESGSGGTGATNVSRRAGKAAGVVTLLLDAAKGAAAVALARLVLTSNYAVNWFVVVAAVMVIIGHCFPVWLRFRGGKGVATGVGVFITLVPLAVAFSGVLFILIVWLTRYVSLGSIIAAATVPLFVWLQHALIRPVTGFQYVMVIAIAGGLLIIFMHRANIARLIRGTESKFG
jgi:glycerol-3-phosphate acyltransferase PlsY